jgi:hypothetical protein
MSEVLESDPILSDLILSEHGVEYTRESCTVANATGDGTVYNIQSGQPVSYDATTKVATLLTQAAINAGGTQTNGLILGKHTVNDGETVRVAVLARGPVVLKEGGFPTKDHLGTDFVAATLKAEYLAGIPQVVTRPVLATTEEQLT